MHLGYLDRLPEVVYVLQQPVVGVNISFAEAERPHQEPAQQEEDDDAYGDDDKGKPGRHQHGIEGIGRGHDKRRQQLQVKEVVVCQVGHLAGEHLEVVGLAATVEQLPVGHDDLAEEAPAKSVDECLLVAGVEQYLPVLQQCSEGQQHHIYQQYAPDCELNASPVSQVLYEESHPFRGLAGADAQQLQQGY